MSFKSYWKPMPDVESKQIYLEWYSNQVFIKEHEKSDYNLVKMGAS
jgi:hypothetical protein